MRPDSYDLRSWQVFRRQLQPSRERRAWHVQQVALEGSCILFCDPGLQSSREQCDTIV